MRWHTQQFIIHPHKHTCFASTLLGRYIGSIFRDYISWQYKFANFFVKLCVQLVLTMTAMTGYVFITKREENWNLCFWYNIVKNTVMLVTRVHATFLWWKFVEKESCLFYSYFNCVVLFFQYTSITWLFEHALGFNKLPRLV